jgi:hypothetical protein
MPSRAAGLGGPPAISVHGGGMLRPPGQMSGNGRSSLVAGQRESHDGTAAALCETREPGQSTVSRYWL